jgi:hypothetical protein
MYEGLTEEGPTTLYISSLLMRVLQMRGAWLEMSPACAPLLRCPPAGGLEAAGAQ